MHGRPRFFQPTTITLLILIGIGLLLVKLYFSFVPDIKTLELWTRQHGYIVLLTVLLLGNVGVPVPEQSLLLLSGVATRNGWLSYPIVWITAVIISIVGESIGYWIGYIGGRRLIIRIGPFIGLSLRLWLRFQQLFEEHGVKIVLFARFFNGIRFVAGLLSGATGMPFRTFLIFNTLGGILWVSVITSLGYYFGPAIIDLLSRTGWISGVIFGVLAVLFFIVKKNRGINRSTRNP